MKYDLADLLRNYIKVPNWKLHHLLVVFKVFEFIIRFTWEHSLNLRLEKKLYDEDLY